MSLIASSGAAGVVLAARILILMQRFTPPGIPDLPSSDDELPTVSICIPARNEMHAMTQCLERAIASDYPKLEIIVLDDSSVDNTSIIVKSFAHAGVRFVEGAPLPEGWLGKTHAQHELFKEASGDYVIFMDVDTLLSPKSISNLVALTLAHRASMLSVLPTREDAWRSSVLFATLRHFWSVALYTRRHPAATTSLWMIKRELPKKTYGKLEPYRLAISPERSLAAAITRDHTYRFFISNPTIGISYEKKWRSQCNTSIRLLYPFLGGNIFFAILGLTALLLLILPFATLVTSSILPWSPVHTTALATSLILAGLYMIYTGRVWRQGWLIGGLLFPIILLQECALLLQSINAYATRTVTWKGRPIRQSARDAASK
jgi:glycosyltransferase involved in cell wall biosynthesis